MGIARVGKIDNVWVVKDVSWDSSTVIGVYSSLDSGLESTWDYIEETYPDSVWVWDARRKILEHEHDDMRFIGFYKYKVDCDDWKDW